MDGETSVTHKAEGATGIRASRGNETGSGAAAGRSPYEKCKESAIKVVASHNQLPDSPIGRRDLCVLLVLRLVLKWWDPANK